MDEKRLNIEAPLLSVRRFASASQKTLDKKHILLYPKSDSTIQLAEPTVPFNWENILGRSKPKEPTSTKETQDERRGTNENDDDDDFYSDALDTIMSPPESVLMNCSVSGVSGLELDNSKANKSGTFHTDHKIRDDFMMNRFLPAAKAMTLEVPEYASSRKQISVVVEQAREINRSFRDEKKLLLKNYITDIIQSSNHCETEEESEDDKYDSTNVSAKGCGLISQLRIKNSLCLLNPVPGMKARNIVPMSSSAFEVPKANKGSYVVKKAIDSIYKNKSSSEAASLDSREVKKKWMSQSCRFTHNSGESQQQDRLSPFRRSRTAASGVSPGRSRPQYPLRGAKLLCDFRETENICQSSRYLTFQSRNHGSNQENNSTVEKTLYIDSANTVKLSSSSSSHSFSPESSHDAKEPQALEQKNMLDSDTNKKAIVVAAGDSSESVLCPVPPPLPKSPSESWLWRALPLVSVRNPLHHSNLSYHSLSVKQDSHTTSSNNTKWETIVKASNLHDDHVRHSQEIATHKSQRLKI